MYSAEKVHDTTLDNKNSLCNIIEGCNNTHQGSHVPATPALALRTSVMLVTLLVSAVKMRRSRCHKTTLRGWTSRGREKRLLCWRKSCLNRSLTYCCI